MILNNQQHFFLSLLLFLFVYGAESKDNYKYCCYIARCEEITQACFSSTLRINGLNCSQACSSSLSCDKGSTLPGRNETCLKSYLKGSDSPFKFVCDQYYEPGKSPAPPLIRTYKWCSQTCGGWRRVIATDMTGWAVPLVVYILPAVVFSIVIPRGYKWEVPNRIFGFELNDLPRPVRICTFLILGTLILSLDMAFWVFIVFGLAPGPMIVGGLHEALLDWRIVQYISHPSAAEHLSQRDKAELILSVLCGNLDIRINNPLEHLFRMLPRETNIVLNIADPHGTESNSTRPNESEPNHSNSDDTIVNDAEYDTIIIQLQCLLNAQQSFGSIVGAPVLFYIGQFIFVLVGLAGDKGDAKAAFGLSFGLWWMSIVHVCVVSGCLLASSNPNTICGMIAESLKNVPLAENAGKKDIALTLGMSTVHESHFIPVPLWDRGRMKRLWLRQTTAYANDEFRRRIEPSPLDWIILTWASILLIFIPTSLAFIVAYFTPAICLGCRSLTFLVYTICQVVLIVATVARTRYLLDVDSNAEAFRVDIFGEIFRTFKKFGFRGRLFYVTSAIFVIAAALLSLLTGFGGTVMQMSGVYENCRCSISATTWMNPDYQTFNLATDSQEDRDSSKYWSGGGYAALIVMAVTTYAGWNYQLGLREALISCIRWLNPPKSSDNS